jgi:hypothetical protein
MTKAVKKETRREELERYIALNGVVVLPKDFETYDEFTEFLAEKGNTGWLLSAEDDGEPFTLYGSSELALLKAWFSQDDKENYRTFVPCSECASYAECKSAWDSCGRPNSDCKDCKNLLCCGHHSCRIQGGKWDIRNPWECVWDEVWTERTEDNVVDLYFKSLDEELSNRNSGATIDLSNERRVWCFASDLEGYPHDPDEVYEEFEESLEIFEFYKDKIVCLEYVKGTAYPEALLKIIPGDIEESLEKIGFVDEGYVMVLRSDAEKEIGYRAADIGHFNAIHISELVKDNEVDFADRDEGDFRYLDAYTFAFALIDVEEEKLPADLVAFLREFNSNYPSKPKLQSPEE